MAKLRSYILFKSRFSTPAVINVLYDTINNCFSQFSLFLNFHSDGCDQYSQLLPQNTLNLLNVEWKINPELAFEIVRSSLKNLSKYQDDEFVAVSRKFKSMHDQFIYKDFYNSRGVEAEKDRISEIVMEDRKKLWDCCSSDLYTIFWMLKGQDLTVPELAYKN